MILSFAPTSASRAPARIRWRDLFLAIAVPLMAFALREPRFFLVDRIEVTLTYTLICVIWSVAVLLAMDINRKVSGYFSLYEARQIVIASAIVASGAALTSFMFYRLDLIPRSFPLLHFVVMASSHMVVGIWSHQRHQLREQRFRPKTSTPEQNILILGCTRLAWYYIRMLESTSHGRQKVIAVLDDRAQFWGRSLGGRVIAGPVRQLPNVIEEYRVHGVRVDLLVATVPRDANTGYDWEGIDLLCRENAIRLTHLPDALEMSSSAPVAVDDRIIEPARFAADEPQAPVDHGAPAPAYWRIKRLLDFIAAFACLLAASPVFIIVGAIAWFDVGAPIFFWQQRIGRWGEPLYVFKFRTLHAPFDSEGNRIPDERRISKLGGLIRRTRMDEIPQLWNILIGEMSFIGPRPLMDIDHPEDDALRSAVQPGVTGWAQVKGGRLITRDEKSALDDYYVRHASFWLDLQILFLTVEFVLRGDYRDEAAIKTAIDERAEFKARSVPPTSVA